MFRIRDGNGLQASILRFRILKARAQKIAERNQANLFFECCGKSALRSHELRLIEFFNNFVGRIILLVIVCFRLDFILSGHADFECDGARIWNPKFRIRYDFLVLGEERIE
jgi:hypothetical protein